MHNPNAFFAVILPSGWFLSKKNEFDDLADLRKSVRLSLSVPIQQATQWYAGHFDAIEHSRVADQFTAWINQTKLSLHTWHGSRAIATSMISQAVQHFGLNDDTIELSKLVWAIVVGGAEHLHKHGHMPVDAHAFIVGYDFKAPE